MKVAIETRKLRLTARKGRSQNSNVSLGSPKAMLFFSAFYHLPITQINTLKGSFRYIHISYTYIRPDLEINSVMLSYIFYFYLFVLGFLRLIHQKHVKSKM